MNVFLLMNINNYQVIFQTRKSNIWPIDTECRNLSKYMRDKFFRHLLVDPFFITCWIRVLYLDLVKVASIEIKLIISHTYKSQLDSGRFFSFLLGEICFDYVHIIDIDDSWLDLPHKIHENLLTMTVL